MDHFVPSHIQPFFTWPIVDWLQGVVGLGVFDGDIPRIGTRGLTALGPLADISCNAPGSMIAANIDPKRPCIPAVKIKSPIANANAVFMGYPLAYLLQAQALLVPAQK